MVSSQESTYVRYRCCCNDSIAKVNRNYIRPPYVLDTGILIYKILLFWVVVLLSIPTLPFYLFAYNVYMLNRCEMFEFSCLNENITFCYWMSDIGNSSQLRIFKNAKLWWNEQISYDVFTKIHWWNSYLHITMFTKEFECADKTSLKYNSRFR